MPFGYEGQVVTVKIIGSGSAKPYCTLVAEPSGYKRLFSITSRLVTQTVWLHKPSGYTGRLVTRAVWLHRPSGYKSREVKSDRPSGYKSRLVTKTIWLQRGRLVT